MNKVPELKAKNKLGLIFFPAFDWEISPTHPERKERLLYTRDQVFEEGLLDINGIAEFNPDIAEPEDIVRANICIPTVADICTKSHLISAGAAMRAAELVLTDQVSKAFAIVRPPGHHAFRLVHGARGFCNINNEAVMVEAIRKHYPEIKIAFVDTDAHHADGTQEIFYHDPNILHISLHQDGRTLFPGSGFLNELGGPGAYAKTLNIPLPPGTTDQGILYAIKQFVLPVLHDFAPDLVINSAGQDNHYSDPLTNMNVSARGYAELNALLDPDLAILQGGYSIQSALPYINVGLILAMAGLDYSSVTEPDYQPDKLIQSKQITEKIKREIDQLQQIWQQRNQIDLEEVYGSLNNGYKREKRIFYDTDQILEEQQEALNYCPDCPGYLFIESQASRGGFRKKKIAALSIPRLICDSCYNEALAKFEELKTTARQKYDSLYLQDLKADQYLIHNF
ncbi:histone deacetylase family protein [Halanaerobium salsuginis]|jgi:acetoin utilization deacetylase AcuC-like enzyme|uniref:Acetoin utilization deacetylase AcuC n=1 Tax=Halanaerobium salsuginis TaxID=29563 RepID=A0A1I4LP46_9FIRM|nr:histone deacetylase [Halanaerobium salsuginis]SFL92606.1 Acetoin utilization deacetylase AcuC [Halanaerobium salsuginis]